MSVVGGLEAIGGVFALDNWAGSVPKIGGTTDGLFVKGNGTVGAAGAIWASCTLCGS